MYKDNVVYLEKKCPDYTGDRAAAQSLVERLMEYYHSRGFRNFKAWLEPDLQQSGRKFWYVRSNAIFRVPIV